MLTSYNPDITVWIRRHLDLAWLPYRSLFPLPWAFEVPACLCYRLCCAWVCWLPFSQKWAGDNFIRTGQVQPLELVLLNSRTVLRSWVMTESLSPPDTRGPNPSCGIWHCDPLWSSPSALPSVSWCYFLTHNSVMLSARILGERLAFSIITLFIFLCSASSRYLCLFLCLSSSEIYP